ncbi:MAG: hypothetical protein P1V34_07780 [Alphaproteobacteria bacterium]|nr:hypothetical protein [Alphaproteobacteria bacterium]
MVLLKLLLDQSKLKSQEDKIASGETASLADANFRFAENSSYLTVNGTWLNSGSDVFSGFNVGTASSEINGTGIIKNGGEITFNNDSINVDIQNTIPLEESDGTIIVTGSGRSLEVNSTITGGTVVVEDSSGMGGTGSLVDLAALKLFDGSSISVSSAEVVGTITLNGSSEILSSLDLTDAALEKDPQASSGDLNIKDGGVVLIGNDTSLDDFSNGRFLLNNGGEVRIGSGETFDLGDFSENNASIREQQSGGTINILGSATIGAYRDFSGLGNNTLSTTINGSGNFSSAGSLSLSGDTVNIQFANLNTGTLQINSGTTTFNADVTSSGTIDIEGTFATNETLTNTGDIDIYQDGDLTGNGRVTNNGGHVTLHSGASMSVASFDNFGGMLDFSHGDATISGGTLDITGGELYADDNCDCMTF